MYTVLWKVERSMCCEDDQEKCLKSALYGKVCVCVFMCVLVEALHLGTLMSAHGYFFPISDHVLTLKDDGTFYRFQVKKKNC